MLIDWFTLLAQAFNFLILVWLLKRFLYKPILHAIDEREKRIAAALADAETKQAEAQKERDVFQQKNDAFDQERVVLLSKAIEEAKAEQQRLLEEAREAAALLSAKRQETLKNEEHSLHQEIGRKIRKEVFAIARKMMTDLAETSLEERLADILVRRLRGLGADQKTGLAEAIHTASEPVLVRSAFDLPAEHSASIQNALNETFSAEIRVRFETAPELISGIELIANGQKVAWSISDYLGFLEKGVDDLLKEQDEAKDKIETQPEEADSETKTGDEHGS